MAYLMIKGAYKFKFGSLHDRLEHAQELGEVKYPKTLDEANGDAIPPQL
jgi:hypothetical protein